MNYLSLSFLLAALAYASARPDGGVLQGPSARASVVGPDGSAIISAVPGGTVITENAPGVVVGAVPPAVPAVAVLAAPAAAAAVPAPAVLAAPAVVVPADFEGQYVPDYSEKLYDDGSYKGEIYD